MDVNRIVSATLVMWRGETESCLLGTRSRRHEWRNDAAALMRITLLLSCLYQPCQV